MGLRTSVTVSGVCLLAVLRELRERVWAPIRDVCSVCG